MVSSGIVSRSPLGSGVGEVRAETAGVYNLTLFLGRQAVDHRVVTVKHGEGGEGGGG